MTSNLGQFAAGVASLRRLMAAMPDDEGRWAIFGNAAHEIAGYIGKGLDRAEAADQLHAMATAHGLTDIDGVQQIIADAFNEIEHVPDLELPLTNGHDKNKKSAKVKSVLVCREAFPIDGSKLPRRPWEVPGLLLRGCVTLFVAPPGIGKSLLTLQIAMMCARGSEWAGWHPRGKYRTLVINVEEDETEMRRRLHGARVTMKYENDLQGILIAKTESIVVAKADSRTKTVTATPMLEEIIQTILTLRIDIVIVDPFAETFAGDENSNSELKWAAVLWREVARRTNCAVLLVHHAKKYAQNMAGDMDASRGGGALAGVARVVSTLFTMTEEEFETHAKEIKKQFPSDADRGRFIRYDDAKATFSLMSPSARWFRKVSVGIGNAGDGLPEDEVGVLIPWSAPDPFNNIDVQAANYILNEIVIGVRNDDGEPTDNPYSPSNQGGSKRWVGLLLQRELKCSQKDAKKIIAKWIETGLLVEYMAPIPSSKGNNRECLKVDATKRPGTIIEESHL